MAGGEFLEHLPARLLLWLGHGFRPRIIAPASIRAKASAARENRSREREAGVSLKPTRKRDGITEPGARPVSASRTEMTEIILPQDANVLGAALGGRVMHQLDMVAAVAALRHCRAPVVTVSVDHIDFRSPIQVGELMILKSSVNRAFRTSLEVGVKVFSENPLTGERRHTTSAYLTFVALDANRQPTIVPPVSCQTAEDRRRYRDALARRKIRLAERYKSR
jgi:acyl-CoA hydrolase